MHDGGPQMCYVADEKMSPVRARGDKDARQPAMVPGGQSAPEARRVLDGLRNLGTGIAIVAWFGILLGSAGAQNKPPTLAGADIKASKLREQTQSLIAAMNHSDPAERLKAVLLL